MSIKLRKCVWCNKMKPNTKYKNKYTRICFDCLTLQIKKGRFVMRFD